MTTNPTPQQTGIIYVSTVDNRSVLSYNGFMKTLTSIQDKQIATELKAIRKHGNNGAARSVIFGARTRAIKAIMDLGFTFQQARDAARDAADMVALELGAVEQPRAVGAKW